MVPVLRNKKHKKNNAHDISGGKPEFKLRKQKDI